MKPNHVWAIARKDLRDAMGNTSVWLPMVIVPAIFIVVIPVAMILIPQMVPGSNVTSDPDIKTFFEKMPASMLQSIAGLDEVQKSIVLLVGYLFAPMFLMIPLMFSTTIAADSFAGERERKTIEALLYTPATDTELFVGKVLAGLLPSITISWAGFIAYTIIVNAVAWPAFGRMWFPLPAWYPLILLVTPALAVLGVSMTVLISTKVKTFQGAYQTSASAVVLVLALVIAQVTGVLYLSVLVGIVVGIVLWIIAVVLLWFAVKTFNRRSLLASVS